MSQDSQIALQGVGTSNKWMFVCFVWLILPGQLPIREREEGKGDGGKGEEE